MDFCKLVYFCDFLNLVNVFSYFPKISVFKVTSIVQLIQKQCSFNYNHYFEQLTEANLNSSDYHKLIKQLLHFHVDTKSYSCVTNPALASNFNPNPCCKRCFHCETFLNLFKT